MGFRLSVHPEVRHLVPTLDDLEKLRAFYDLPNANVQILPRAHDQAVLGKKTLPYAFRAVTRGNDTWLFVDDITENRASVAWLLAHELTHHMVKQSPTLTAAFEDSRPLDIRPISDAFHRVDAEERFCDGIATRLVGERFDRDWWRARTRVKGLTKGR